MIFGSVCSGIEAASTAWEPLGWRAAWVAEIEPFPSAVLAHHWPEVPNLGDFTKIRDRLKSWESPAPEVLVGGTPCQAFSVAGLRQSMDDARGQLTIEFVRLANAIDATRSFLGIPECIVVWENVPGVLNTPDNAFGCFLAGLAGEDDPLLPPGGRWTNAGRVLGPSRAVAWRILDAQYFGVAQRRRRVFVVASAREGFDPAAVLFEFDGVRRDSPPSREAGQGSTADAGRSAAGGGLGTDFDLDGGLIPSVAGTLDRGIPGRGAGNAAGYVDHLIASTLMSHAGIHDNQNQTFVVEPLPFDTTQATSKANRSSPKPGDPCHPLAAGAHAPAIAFDSRQDPVSSSRVFGSIGSSLPQAQAVAVALRGRDGGATAEIGDDAAFTLRASTGGGDKPHAMVGMQVRRLTPTECERLQGFPDGHTRIPWRGKPADECPDGPRYKALGNSMAVPVMAWLGERIEKALGATDAHP